MTGAIYLFLHKADFKTQTIVSDEEGLFNNDFLRVNSLKGIEIINVHLKLIK